MANEALNDAVEDDAVVVVIQRQEDEAVHGTRGFDGIESDDQCAHRGFHGGRVTLDVDAALTRLDDGTYWVDEITGQPLPDAVLAANPLARRHPA